MYNIHIYLSTRASVRSSTNVQENSSNALNTGNAREIAIVENICLVHLLDSTADFGVKTNEKLRPIFKLQERSKTFIQNCLYVHSSPDSVFFLNFLTYIL